MNNPNMIRKPSQEQRTIFNFNYRVKIKTKRSKHFETITQYRLRGEKIIELDYFPGVIDLPLEFTV